MNATETQTTPEGTEFTTTGSRVIFPTPDHEDGGGVSLTDEIVNEILASPEKGSDPDTQTGWEYTGRDEPTRAGDSKVIAIVQISFGHTRRVEVTLVDIADANAEAI